MRFRFRYNCQFFSVKFSYISIIMFLGKWSAPGHLRLADFGLSRRLERGGRAFTICGTIQYMGETSHPRPQSYSHMMSIYSALTFLMRVLWVVHSVLWACSVCSAAPEVLSGGPYSHAADWWSMGILLFSLVTGKVRSFTLLSWHSVSFESDFFFRYFDATEALKWTHFNAFFMITQFAMLTG